jgi:hypothetical protein
VYVTADPVCEPRLPLLPEASVQVTFLSAVTFNGIPTFAAGAAGVKTGDPEGVAPDEVPVPVPVRRTGWGELAALSAIESDADSLPLIRGVKATITVQLAPTPTLAPQLLAAAKSPLLAPVTVIPEIDSVADPEFDTVIA